jgi:hypothetical protein
MISLAKTNKFLFSFFLLNTLNLASEINSHARVQFDALKDALLQPDLDKVDALTHKIRLDHGDYRGVTLLPWLLDAADWYNRELDNESKRSAFIEKYRIAFDFFAILSLAAYISSHYPPDEFFRPIAMFLTLAGFVSVTLLFANANKRFSPEGSEKMYAIIQKVIERMKSANNNLSAQNIQGPFGRLCFNGLNNMNGLDSARLPTTEGALKKLYDLCEACQTRHI